MVNVGKFKLAFSSGFIFNLSPSIGNFVSVVNYSFQFISQFISFHKNSLFSFVLSFHFLSFSITANYLFRFTSKCSFFCYFISHLFFFRPKLFHLSTFYTHFCFIFHSGQYFRYPKLAIMPIGILFSEVVNFYTFA